MLAGTCDLVAMTPEVFDETAMRLALDQALNAQLAGEVPVGAVIVRRTEGGPQVVATGYNRPITTYDPTAHAEIVALRHAAQLAENYRLPDLELYVTLGAVRDVRDGDDACAAAAAWCSPPPIPRRAPRARWSTCSATARSTITRELLGGVLAEPAGGAAARVLQRTACATARRTRAVSGGDDDAAAFPPAR